MSEPPQSQADRETDALAERFFSQPPQAWEVEPEAWRPSPLSQTESLAMLATVAPVAIGVTVAVGWLLLSNPLFASAEPGPQAQASAKAAAAAPRASHDATQHGLTALAKAAVIETRMQPEAQPELPSPVAAAAPIAAPAPHAAATPRPAARSNPSAAAAGTPLKRARQALDAGDAQRARALATEAIGREPTRAAAYIVLAGALDALGDRAGMQATFRSCAERATDTLASACKSLSR